MSATSATEGIATVTLGPSRGNDRHPQVFTTTATGASIEMSELMGGDPLGTQRKPVSQTLMEGRIDFHTNPRSLTLANMQLSDWRTQDKLRTAMSLLVACLNLGIDPPDLVRPKESATLEAWVDPNAPVPMRTPEELALQAANTTGSAQRSAAREPRPITLIGDNLVKQFESVHRQSRFKPLMDCNMEDLQKYCLQARRAAKEDRLLFYYNGHGVPRPTPSGDIWVFNRQFTQYLPVNAGEMMGWIGTPCVYVWDCSHAMNIVKTFESNAKKREVEIARIRHAAEAAGTRLPQGRPAPETMTMITSNIAAVIAAHNAPASASAGAQGHQSQIQQQQQQQQQQPGQNHQQHQPNQAPTNNIPINPALINLALLPPMHHEDIHFAASRSDEQLPTNPELPADLFTACLTTPVKVALRNWVIRNPHSTKVTLEMCDKLPGTVQDRRTPFGELNWIFTSITDTIAWSTLPRELFRKLFRQDVVVATMYRNFMLADRIMRFYGVHPQASPSIPPTHKHPLWDSLDLEIDMCLQQLPRLLREEERRVHREERAKRMEQQRMARMGSARSGGAGSGAGSANGAQRYAGANGAGGPSQAAAAAAAAFGLPRAPKLTIASTFNKMSTRHGSRIGLGGAGESDDDFGGSGSDSDDGCAGADLLGMDAHVGGYISSTYFSNQLYAFEVWLQHAATVVSHFLSSQGPDQLPRSLSLEPPPNLDPPDELPAVLQVLLSQQYRLRALILLYRFMHLGPWAVDLALAVGIFPYMFKLLASTTTEIREILILVWARLSAVDLALYPELLKSEGYKYFINYLTSNIHMQYEPCSEKVRLCDSVSAASAFTLTIFCRDTPAAQKACFGFRLLDYFLLYLQRPDNGTEERACLRTWILLCLAELWKGQSNPKWMAMTYKRCVITTRRHAQEQERAQQMMQETGQHDAEAQAPSIAELLASSADDDSVEDKDAQDLLIQMAFHRSPTVRASAIYAVNTLLQDLATLDVNPGVQIMVRKAEAQLFPLLLQAALDGSPMVRREVAQAISSAVFASYMPQAVEAVSRVVTEELRDQRRTQTQHPAAGNGGDSASAAGAAAGTEVPDVSIDMLVKLYKVLLKLSMDPHPDVALVAREACDILMQCYAHSRAFFEVELALDQALHRLEISRTATGHQPILSFLHNTGNVGDALLGYPPIGINDVSPSRDSSGTLPTQQSASSRQTVQQQHQQMQAQRRLSAHVGMRGSSATALGSPRGRGDLAGSQGSGVPPSHRYTMHFTQQQQQQQQQAMLNGSSLLAGDQQSIHTQNHRSPRSPSVSGSIGAASMHNLDAMLRESPASNSHDRFAGLTDIEREEALHRLDKVESAWHKWGRAELRSGVCESTLVDWAGAHYTEFDISLFANVSGQLQGSAALVESRERNRRVDRMEASARAMSSAAGVMKWTDATTVASIASPASAALLHPLEPHAIVATRRGTVSVFDWEMQAQVAQYSVGARADASLGAAAVSSLHLVNPLGQAKLLVGSADGVVRIFASHAPDFTPPPAGQVPAFPRPRLLTAFTALPWAATPAAPAASNGIKPTTLVSNSQRMRAQAQKQRLQQSSPNLHADETSPQTSNAATASQQQQQSTSIGLVTAWNQRSGVLFAGGDDKEIRVWDINTEMCIEEIPVSSMGGITSISHDGVSGNLFAVGNVDGVVRVLDRRMEARNAVVANWREHAPHAIRNVFMRPGQTEVVSASAGGDVKYWDLRHRQSVFTLANTHPDRGLTHMIAHESAPVTLTASDATVKLWNQRGSNIGVVTAANTYGSAASYMKSLAGYGTKSQNALVTKVNAVAMHPYLPVALMVCDDGRVSYIQPRKLSQRPPSLAASRANTMI
ncbi:Target of rapamycin complex 1 subunit kog1 [Coemansia sp. Benny D115]|nr:Target of rapamycin complex 1 subunit kog1 [Coemansia sp. Benny D115]